MNWKKLVGFVPLAIATAVMLYTFLYRTESFRETFRYSLQGMGLFVMVLNLMFWPQLKIVVRALENSIAQWIGRVSYGVYLWHIPFMMVASDHLGMTLAEPDYVAFVVTATFVATAISYYGMEKPIVKLRKKFGSHTREDGKIMSKKEREGKAGGNAVPAPAE